MAAVEVSDLVVRYGDVTAVDGASFVADHGQVLALLGPNGAGKTSTVETLEGYRRPSDGRVRVLDRDPVTDAKALAPRIGVMLQTGGVYPGMGSREALTLFASYYADPEPVDALLQRVGLADVATTPWRRLSGGEQQRLSLALALVGRPDVAFLDEPTAGIDPQGRLLIRKIIRQLRDDGVCVVLTTHELDEAERSADRIVILDHGRVVADGTLSDLRGGGAADLRGGGAAGVRFGALPGLDVAALALRVKAPVVEERPGEYHVDAPGTPALVAALTAWLAEHDLPLADLRAGRETLEDVFLRLTGPSAAEASRSSGPSGDQKGPRRRSRQPEGTNEP